MDEYDKKFAEMQKYIPFLEAMIERLQNVKDKSREVQLQKMQSLHGILSNSKRKLKIETLQRCEDVLQKLHNKVEKGNTPGLHFPHKKNDASATQSSTASEDTKSQYVEDAKSQRTEDAKPSSSKETEPQHVEQAFEDGEIHETPASPSPPVSPDSGSQVAPIIIPTERKIDFDDKSDSKPASPDPIDTLPTKAPIIIPTERTNNDLTLSPQHGSCKSSDDVSFSEWDMLEENENQIARNKNWQTIVSSGHDVATAVKMVGSNLPQKVNDGRTHAAISMHSSRQIPTVPVPSLGGSRRLSSILEKNRLVGVNLDQVPSDSRPESPASVSEVRLKSPDVEILFPKHGKNTPPRLKDNISRSNSKPSAPLLLSPPASTEPPLSMEDLAELLNEGGDNKAEKKGDRLTEDSGKLKKDKQELNALGGTNNDGKNTQKSFLLTQEDIDSESERRWEEIDKHIVKLTSRKCLPNSSTSKADSMKSSETKGPPQGSLGHGSSSFVDSRNQPSSPGSKMEPRFADNYERHPRQLRDNHGYDKDKANVHNMHCRPDDDMSNQIPILHSGPAKSDDRNVGLYQRRQGNVGPEIPVPPRIDTEFRMEGPEYFNRQVPNQSHWHPPMHPPVNTNEFCNNQWPPPSNFSGMPNSPAQTYRHPMGMHDDMWNVGANREPIHMDPHQMNEGQVRPNQFPGSINAGIRPLMSLNTASQDISHIPRPDEMLNVDVPNVPVIAALTSPTRFPVAPPYRNFQGENRPYDQSFDRGMEYSHQRQSWDSPSSRSSDVSYRAENEVPCGVMGPTDGPPGPYSRPSTPCPWNRDRDRGSNRGRNAYYNERSRGEPRNTFNRDTRRPEWTRDHNEWDNCNRFGRDARNISDRDPRIRMEHGAINQSPSQSRDNGTSVRDPRLAKDKHFPTGKGKDGGFNERDPRKRSTTAAFVTSSFRKNKDKVKSSSKSADGHRRADIENGSKQAQEKAGKDKMQSPLESLYGVIDTKAKSAQGYCLQNFKIPKIKRNESSESPTSSHNPEEMDKYESKTKKKDKEDVTAEVSSSSDGNILLEDWSGDNNVVPEKKEESKEVNTSTESAEEKSDVNINEADTISTTSTKLLENVEKPKKDEMEPEGSKTKDGVTQEWIEALIRKSFEFGEGKKFVEQAKFMQKLGEVLQTKKLKIIKKIIESDSESSSSGKDNTQETKKVRVKKKRRVIVSDSSDDESLAERLGILNATSKDSIKDTSVDNKDKKEETSKTVEEKTRSTESTDLSEKDVNTKDPTILEETPSTIEEQEKPKDDKANIVKQENVPETCKKEIKEEPTEDKEATSKAPKVRTKRRNSLEMLQEDIREMFISDGVVAATGHRLCRTQKENNPAASTSNQNAPVVKKDDSTKREVEMDSDAEDTVVPPKQKKATKSRASDESIKTRGKPKREAQRITRQRSKQYTLSSDSEEDQPLALRTELVQNISSLSTQEVCSDESEVLRRSKRIINKETIREPRVVVEKTDISKLELSKVMFDSSSDESFGIDVSELAAAVDISLHPDKQPEPEPAEPTEKKKYSPTSSRKSTRKRTGEATNECKDDGQFSDEGSIISDISMSSSVASAKKATSSSSKTETSGNEELLSNILFSDLHSDIIRDVEPSKNSTDKDSLIVDKGSDADVDDDVGEVPVELNTKKFSAKKKKKKCNWQMGILSKKKKKKATLAALSPKGDSDLHNVSSEMETSIKTSTSSVAEDVASKDLSDDMNQTVLEEPCDKPKEADSKQITDDDSKQQKTDESSNSSDSVEKKEASCKISGSEESLEVKDNKRKDKLASSAEKSTSKSKEDSDKSYNDLDIKKLIDYVWTGQERYKCLLCFFTGKNIVHHYKLNHPGKEILISRLKASDAKLAIQDAKDNNIEKMSTNPVTEETCKFRCRFCSLFTEGAAKVAMEAFYEHCTTHTGEYRFRCNTCPYQAVAKSSMRTHYYKVCRRFKDTFVEAITEDEIPDENCICGYLCSNCNYIQLKRSNVKQHIDLWHKHDSNVEIIKINMSLSSIEEETDKQIDEPEKKVKVEELALGTEKVEESANDSVTSVIDNDDEVIEIEDGKENKISDNKDKKEKDAPEVQPQKEDQLVPQQTVSDEKKKAPSTDADSSLSTGNMSVFVCPPELEKKEVEIQLERKRKMQEIIQNIGIKLQKDASKKGLSIIDKLKDKMKTNVMTVGNETDSNAVPDSPSKISTDSTISPSTTPSECNTIELLSSTNVSNVENLEVDLPLSQDNSDNKGTEDSTSKKQPPSTECESQPTPEVNPVESQVRDPLTMLDQKKSDKSDGEISDNENMRDAPPIFDSDSSSEQSDGELPTDVNMILKETSSINASSKDPMLTTIQRLAAQLQATKPLETCKDKASLNSEGQNTAFSTDHIPKPPDVVPIASIKKFVGKMQNRFHEISNESQDDSNQPKNFIRLRRLSGDMLSVPVQSSSDQEGLPVSKINVSESATPEKIDTLPKSDGEEECSFLKIENVVSLAPRADNDSAESPIINDIRKAVETSPIKSKGVSLLKKSNSPLILKRVNAVTIAQPLTKNIQTVQSTPETLKLIPVKSLSPAPVSVTTTQLAANFIPIAPKSKIIQVDNKLSFPITTTKSTVVSQANTRTVTVTGSPQPSNLNYKILKVVRTPAIKPTVTPIIKPKEMAMKLKSTDNYHAMLKASKLVQLYKCMARECRFTTDTLAQYHQHYNQHTNEVEKRNMLPPYDYQKCAYCYITLEDWNQLKTHIDEKHAYCRYQCMYCFYRAVVPSYVQIHQMLSHPGHRGILLGKQIKEIPLKKDINRHEFVYPYVCQNGFLDCGKFFYVPESFMAHLKNKHSTLTATYKCHVCRATFRKVQQLIPHYKMHGFNKYQCLYCLHGSDSFNDMHNHLSAHHCNRLPQTLERSLPPKAVRNKDVIEQLIIRTLDETFKMTEEVVDVENDGKDGTIQVLIDRNSTISSSPAQKLFRPILPKDVTILNKEESELLNKSICSLFGTGNTSSSPINATFTLQEKSLNESSNDSASSKPFGSLISDSDVSIISNKESPEKSLLDTSKKSSSLLDKSPTEAMDPSEGTFDCSDEFININLLDNPDFLKKVSNCSTDVSMVNKSTVDDDNKQEDSDIEIVDIVDREVVPAKSIKSECDKKDSGDLSNKSKVESEVDTKEQQSCNVDVKDLNSCTDTNRDSSDTTKTDKPLTLEDIKDTGFSGTKLYKCGYETCDFGAPSAAHLRTHVKECSLGGDNKNLACAHCGKRFMKVGFLLEHIKSHGLKRFGCALCKMRCTVGYQAMAHMKMKHKYGCSKLVPADPKNPSADGLFIVQPISQNGERKGKKRKTGTKISEKEATEKGGSDSEKFTFSPDEIEALPRQAIYNREVQCAVCPYTTKVRMNIIRHLQLHAKDESVPESGPVNPVPCLDKKERMFDKMVNLASSSHQNGRMGGKPKEANKNNDDEFIPKFVPEHKRYVCGVAECNYLTVDEAMLRCHFKALHSEEQYFRCPHCPQPPPGQEGLNIAIDKMAVHLKMHDTRLYKCSHCNHHHYHRHVVERHLSDKHPEKRPFVKVIRELENTENNQQSVQEEIEEELPDPDGNHWKCNVCDYKCVYKAEMVNHTTVTHDEKCQYKCSSCSFKTSGKIMFEQHVNSKHSNDPNVDYVLMYQRIKGINKKSTDNVEQGGQDEPFDTTPLWRRDMPRIRHIRGILLEEEDEVASESNSKTAKRKSDVDVSTARPAKIKPGKSGSLDDAKQTKEKSKRSLSCDKVSTDVENVADSTPSTVDKPKETKVKSIEDNDFNESDVGRFGPYGKADGNMYVCTLCTQFKTKYKHDMRDHLYRELNYARWHCKDCGYLSVNRNALLKHFNKHHNGERPNHEPLSPDNDIEEWVGTLLRRQTSMIKGLLGKQNASNVESSATMNSTETKPIPTRSTQSTVNKTSKVANVTDKSSDKPSDTQDNKNKKATINVETLDGNSKDNDTPVVNANDDNTLKKDESVKTTDADKAEPEEEQQEKPLTCKHCNMTFSRWRGFKLHVQLTHLKRLGFICPYCDRSTNSEGLMRQHIRSRHPGCDEKIVQNPAAGGPELPEEFWRQEYGIVFPKRNRKRKRRISGEEIAEKSDSQAQVEPQEKCNMCDFTSTSTTGLKIHMRTHTARNILKCCYCSFNATTNSEMWDHWEINHPFTPYKVEEIPPEISVLSVNVETDKKTTVEDYSNDIVEEEIPDTRQKEAIYYCYYCSFRSKFLDVVQTHWSTEHNQSSLSNDSTSTKSNCPFRYKEVSVSTVKSLLKGQSSRTENPYEMYLPQELEASGTKDDGWICQWCNELCDSEVQMKTHHSMFHSHLPLNFKQHEKSKLSRGYKCPECTFTTTFINVMKNHVTNHINLFKCKYCKRTCGSPREVSNHSVKEHPEMEVKIESIENYEELLEDIMSKVRWYKWHGHNVGKTEDWLASATKTQKAVARKSTARNAFRPNIIPHRINAVAKKSTNPHSRYLISNRQLETKSKQFSYYGAPRSPVNLAKLNTYMVVGGHRMKVNCTTLAQLININPKIVLKDLKYDINNLATLKKLK